MLFEKIQKSSKIKNQKCLIDDYSTLCMWFKINFSPSIAGQNYMGLMSLNPEYELDWTKTRASQATSILNGI